MIANLLSVDVEDYYHFIGSRHTCPVPLWDGLESHVERLTDHLLCTLEGRRATFFCLGWVAQRYPALIRRIADQGNEIGSHGMYHEEVFSLGPERFLKDAEHSRKLLEDCCGQPVTAYRAPGFSVRPCDRWFFSLVRRAGYLVDSSLFPGWRTLGGIPGAPIYPHLMSLDSGDLWEIPVSTVSLAGMRTAFCGGGFFRVFPFWFIRGEIRRLNAAGQPAVVYIHPRDLTPDQPRIRLEPVNSFFYRYGLASAEHKWRRLLDGFLWRPFGDWVTIRMAA